MSRRALYIGWKIVSECEGLIRLIFNCDETFPVLLATKLWCANELICTCSGEISQQHNFLKFKFPHTLHPFRLPRSSWKPNIENFGIPWFDSMPTRPTRVSMMSRCFARSYLLVKKSQVIFSGFPGLLPKFTLLSGSKLVSCIGLSDENVLDNSFKHFLIWFT